MEEKANVERRLHRVSPPIHQADQRSGLVEWMDVTLEVVPSGRNGPGIRREEPSCLKSISAKRYQP